MDIFQNIMIQNCKIMSLNLANETIRNFIYEANI